MTTTADPDRFLSISSLFLASLFFFASDFFWTQDGQYGAAGGLLLVVGSIFWIFAFKYLFSLFRATRPLYSALGWFVAVYGCICGGAAFGLLGYFNEVYGVARPASLAALAAFPVATNIIFWIGGPAFPVSLVVLGFMLMRTKMVRAWIGIALLLGGLLFPVGRIFRLQWFAHIVALIILIPMWAIARQALHSGGLNRSGQVRAA